MSGISPFSQSKQAPVILVADDDKTIRLLLRQAMEKEGYRVVEAADGKQCLVAYEIVKPDIVLLDAIMPVMDGFTCCKQLLQIARNNLMTALEKLDTESPLGNTVISKLWERTPILMITSLDDQESVDRAFDAGATDYLTKPIHWAVLRQRLRRLLQQAQVYKQLEAANQALQHLANIDGLTGLANRRRFDDYLNTQWINSAQEKSALSLILCDVDFFKLYNDQYGHPAGDICIREVGNTLNYTAQNHQVLVARYGGEEFAVIMPYTDAAAAFYVATSMQAAVTNLQIAHSDSTISPYVTISMGVATITPTWESSAADLVMAADQALYQAKKEGRNRIVQNSWLKG
ncbi:MULTISPECIES: PleD family two-component system response regulator [unclassified Nodularia (in: cyanobacteria)]|uniref:response regulator n=1 Tax=unclassified Nodularia (in: cyanobacteria) TaxID=2656917 RepID=UPI00187FD8B2|nr:MULTISPECIES: PleD family two-component system response regulator [unclassified Nodularia (in: cyanobacteria)]MBE9198117.1 PleD family two-component system response regulator [Nodularia sp. LEGE 06071]MCC2693192.1 PleD family two-component system response regulator [Nodularia sp. LEGE 04288]